MYGMSKTIPTQVAMDDIFIVTAVSFIYISPLLSKALVSLFYLRPLGFMLVK